MAQSLGYNCMFTQNNMKPTVRKTLGAKKTPGMKNLQPYPQNVYTPGERLHVKGHGTSARSLQKAGTKIPRKDDPLPQKIHSQKFFLKTNTPSPQISRGALAILSTLIFHTKKLIEMLRAKEKFSIINLLFILSIK